MSISEARILANRRNAARSTGPRTEEGKAASRANSFKHGLTGDGIVQAPDDAALAARRAESFAHDLKPTTDMGRYLVERVARLSVRMDRCAEREFAEQEKNVGRALADYDESREAEADALMLALVETDDPAARRKLKRSPEGLLRLIGAWNELKAAYQEDRWAEADSLRARQLSGSPSWTPSPARIEAELTDLEERLGEVDFDAIDRERAGAPARALFDPSKQASLARKYEAAAERGFYRAIKELRKIEAEARSAGAEPRSASSARGSLASFFPGPSAPRPAQPFGPIGPSSGPTTANSTAPSAPIAPISSDPCPSERPRA